MDTTLIRMCECWFHVCLYTESKLKEYEVEEKDVLKILTQVNVTRRECEIVRTLLLLDFETDSRQDWVSYRDVNENLLYYRDWKPLTLMRRKRSTRGKSLS